MAESRFRSLAGPNHGRIRCVVVEDTIRVFTDILEAGSCLEQRGGQLFQLINENRLEQGLFVPKVVVKAALC